MDKRAGHGRRIMLITLWALSLIILLTVRSGQAWSDVTEVDVENAVTIAPAPAPATPGPVTVSNIGCTEALLSWAPVQGSSSYMVCLNDQPYISTDMTSMELTGLAPATVYNVAVAATNGSGTSSAGPDVQLTTNNNADIHFMVTNIFSDRVFIQWDPVPGAENYDINVNSNNLGNTVKNSYEIDSLAPGTEYNITLTPEAAGMQGVSYNLTSTTQPAPAPANLTTMTTEAYPILGDVYPSLVALAAIGAMFTAARVAGQSIDPREWARRW